MNLKERYYEQIRRSGHRLTENRKAMIQILENQHLTFKEIQSELQRRGFYNVASIYNNLEFLVSNNIVIEIFVNNEKYYDLAMDNPGHNRDSHIHIGLKDTGEITEIVAPDIFNYIANHKDLNKLKINSIRIIISAENK